MRREKEFELLSGVPCVIKELTGLEERIITQGSSNDSSRFTRMLASCIVSIGDKTTVTDKDVLRMLDGDRKHALIELRQFSNDYDPKFKFTYEFPLKNKRREKHEFEVDFTYSIVEIEDRSENPVIDNSASVNFKGSRYYKKWSSYEEMREDKIITVQLPKSGDTVEFELLDAEMASKFSRMPDEDRSSHTYMEMHGAKTIVLSDKGKEPTKLKTDLDRMVFKDINFLREQIRLHEGGLDTYIKIQNPNDPTQVEKVDLITIPAFFFPSLAI